MRCKRYIAWLSLILLFLAFGCSKPPQKEMEKAAETLEKARRAKARDYAFGEYALAEEAMKRAHKAYEVKRYREAKKYALEALEKARNSLEITQKNIAIAKEEASKDLAQLDPILSEACKLLELRREELAMELKELNISAESIKKAYDEEDFKKASETAVIIYGRAEKIIERLQNPLLSQ